MITSARVLPPKVFFGKRFNLFSAASAVHNYSGTDIDSGVVEEAYIDGAIARDTELATHSGDTGNPHGVTLTQASDGGRSALYFGNGDPAPPGPGLSLGRINAFFDKKLPTPM